jgi:aspartyl-tRNA(Asn)/glutamyl-tRNA(Gln) amidotransferase subunit A
LPELRIAFSPEDGYAPVAREVQAVVAKAAAALREQGCIVEEVGLPWLNKRNYLEEGLEVMLTDGVQYARPIIGRRDSELAHNMVRVMEWKLPDFERYLMIEHVHIGELKRDTTEFFRRYDVLLGPTSVVPAPPHGAQPLVVDGRPAPWFNVSKNTCTWDITGSPALSVPFGWSRDGRLPIGVQLIGPHFTENTLYKVAAVLERASEGRGRRPPL